MGNPVKVSIINAVYYPIKGRASEPARPGVALIGRDIETKAKVYYACSVDPHFYVEDWILKGVDLAALRKLGAKKIEYSTKRTLSNRLTRKISVRKCSNVDEILTYLRKVCRARAYEADLAKVSGLPIRFLTEHHLTSGFEVKDGDMYPADVEPVLRYWLFDIEWISSRAASVDARRDEPIVLFSWYDNFDDKIFTVYWHERDFQALSNTHKVYKAKCEKELLYEVQKNLEEQNPDLLAAHNLYRADLAKWFSRMLKHRMNLNLLSPKPFRKVSMYPRTTIKGRVLFDVLSAFKLYTNKELARYSLEYIAEHEKLGVPKIPLKGTTSKYWNDEISIDVTLIPEEAEKYLPEEVPSSFVLYLRNYLDVLILKLLEDKHSLINFFASLRAFAGCLFEDTFFKYKIYDAALLRMCSNTALPTAGRYSGSGGFRGALVIEPEPGIYDNVVCIDFKRQYPMIIRGMNISPETFAGVEYKDPGNFAKRMLRKGYCVAYNERAAYAFKSKPKGIMVKLVEYYWKQRDRFEEAALRAAKAGDREAEKIAKRKAFQTKQILNSAFGVTSYSAFRLYKRESCAAIPFMARIGSEKTLSKLNSRGYRVLYGDTDSMFFISSEGIEQLKQLIDEISAELNREAKEKWNAKRDLFALDLQRIYKKFIVLTKKRYAGLYMWDSKEGFTEGFEWKGLEAIRSDSSVLERTAQREVITMLLREKRKEEILEYVKGVLRNIDKRAYPLIEVGFPEKIGKRFKMAKGKIVEYGYGNRAPANVKAAFYSNLYLGTDYSSGDKPIRLPIIPGKLSSFPRRFTMVIKYSSREYECKWIAIDESLEIPEEIKNAVDWNKIKSRFLNKMSPLLKLAGIEISELEPKENLNRWIKCGEVD